MSYSTPGDELLSGVNLGNTPEELSALLMRFCTGLVDGSIKVNPLFNEICHRIDEFPGGNEETEQGRQWGKKLMGVIGPDWMASAATYWTIRDRVQAYQQANGISGVVTTAKTIAGKQVEYKELNCQLAMLESDPDLTRESVFPVTRFFCSTVEELGYPIYYKPDDDTYEQVIPEFVWNMANNAWQVSIRQESFEWGPVRPDGSRLGRCVDREFPDRISLGFAVGNPEDDHWEYFEAERPDYSEQFEA